MSDPELKALKAEIANTEGTIRNLRHHADQLVKEAAGMEKTLEALKARLPAEKPAK